ncbi:MAG TPA: Bax inhibitor-1/YccA family protein [Gemmatimonadaceae bacterium]|nr:Bax inhibitor-1/YccA family protein [Gemmatimonadaceae bacterium]
MGFSRYALPAAGLIRTGEERATLVRRTYSLVFASVVITVLGTFFGLQNASVMQAVAAHPFISAILWFSPLLLAHRARATTPQRLGLVLLFAFVSGVLYSPLIFIYERTSPGISLQAGALTLSAFGVLTAYAWLSRRDFSAWGSFFVVGLWVLIATSLVNIFLQNQTASLWIAAATVVVFSGLLVFDTWRLRNVFGPEQYVGAAVQIYLDLLNMFLAVLQLLGGGRRQ